MKKIIKVFLMLLLISTTPFLAFATEQSDNNSEYVSSATINFMHGSWKIKSFLGFPNSTKHDAKDITPYCEKLIGKEITITSDLFDSESIGINKEYFSACATRAENVRYKVKDIFKGKESALNLYRNYKLESEVIKTAADDEVQIIRVYYTESADFIPDLSLLVVNNNRLLISLSDGYFELERTTSEVTYDGIEYITHSDFVTVTGYSGYSRGVITIPKELNGLPVTDIGTETFSGKHHPTGIILPDSIINIGDEAFENMFASYFHLGNGITNIGDYAFRMCGVSQVNLPDSVVNIGKGAFYDCYGLKYIVIPAGVKEIKADTFKECRGLIKVIFLNPDTEISLSAFDSPANTNLVIYGYINSKVEKFANDNGYTFKPYIPIKINGKEITPVNATPEIVREDIYVPLRFIVEALSHTVEYYEVDGQGEISTDGGAFYHIIGTDFIRWMGGDIVEPKLLNKSYVENGITMVSPDFIKQAIKCEIFWDKINNCIEIFAK